jgi:vesicle transport protein SEC22
LYEDSREASSGGSKSNMDRLNDELGEITNISEFRLMVLALRLTLSLVTKNMEDLLWRGDSLDRMSSMSSSREFSSC